jgi:hypothetical protein
MTSIGDLLVDDEVRAQDLHGVLTLHPAQGLLDVVADVLGEVETHPRKRLGELLAHLLGEPLLGDVARPLAELLQRSEELDVVELGKVGAVVGTAELRDHGFDELAVRRSVLFRTRDFRILGAATEDAPHSPDVF